LVKSLRCYCNSN